MRGNVFIPSIFTVPSRVVLPSFDIAAKIFPLSPRLIGFTVSATLHGFLGAALLYRSEVAPTPEVEPEMLVVEFVPVGIESAHPQGRAQAIDLAVRRDVLPAQRLTPAAHRGNPLNDAPPTEQVEQPVDRVPTEPSITRDSAHSAAVSSAQFDKGDSSDDLRARYESAVLAKIEGAKRYPTKARHRRLKGSLTVRLHLRPDGGVNSVVISRSSGVPVFDQEALQMVSRAIPFPPAPADIDPAALTFSVPIVFRFE